MISWWSNVSEVSIENINNVVRAKLLNHSIENNKLLTEKMIDIFTDIKIKNILHQFQEIGFTLIFNVNGQFFDNYYLVNNHGFIQITLNNNNWSIFNIMVNDNNISLKISKIIESL
jgi:hypothetical protein